jgi:hypothetical protein
MATNKPPAKRLKIGTIRMAGYDDKNGDENGDENEDENDENEDENGDENR